MKTHPFIFWSVASKERRVGEASSLPKLPPPFKAHCLWNRSPPSRTRSGIPVAAELSFRSMSPCGVIFGQCLVSWFFTHNFHVEKIAQSASEKEKTVRTEMRRARGGTGTHSWNKGRSCGPEGLESLVSLTRKLPHWGLPVGLWMELSDRARPPCAGSPGFDPQC